MLVMRWAAVEFAARSLVYMRFPDTGQVLGGSGLTLLVSNSGLVWRYFVMGECDSRLV